MRHNGYQWVDTERWALIYLRSLTVLHLFRTKEEALAHLKGREGFEEDFIIVRLDAIVACELETAP